MEWVEWSRQNGVEGRIEWIEWSGQNGVDIMEWEEKSVQYGEGRIE